MPLYDLIHRTCRPPMAGELPCHPPPLTCTGIENVPWSSAEFGNLISINEVRKKLLISETESKKQFFFSVQYSNVQLLVCFVTTVLKHLFNYTAVFVLMLRLNSYPQLSVNVNSCPQYSAHVNSCPPYSAHVNICPQYSAHVNSCPQYSAHVNSCPQYSVLVNICPQCSFFFSLICLLAFYNR
jgi:hypothetical protein